MRAAGNFFYHVPTLVPLQYFPLAIVSLYVTVFEEDLVVKYNMLIMLCNTLMFFRAELGWWKDTLSHSLLAFFPQNLITKSTINLVWFSFSVVNPLYPPFFNKQIKRQLWCKLSWTHLFLLLMLKGILISNFIHATLFLISLTIWVLILLYF